MARDFTASTSNFLRENTNGDVNAPGSTITVHAWINPDDVGSTRSVIGRWGNANGNRQFLIQILAQKVNVNIGDATGNDNVSGATSVSTGAWHSVALRKNGSGAGALQAWLDGAQDGSTTSNRNAQSLGNVAGSQFRISLNSNSVNPFDGRIAECAIWLEALTDAELVALSRGVSPFAVRPGSLLHYWPVWGQASPENDLDSSPANLVVVGTLAAADHAPVGRPFPVAA